MLELAAADLAHESEVGGVRVGEEAAVVFTELLLVRTTGSREPVGE